MCEGGRWRWGGGLGGNEGGVGKVVLGRFWFVRVNCKWRDQGITKIFLGACRYSSDGVGGGGRRFEGGRSVFANFWMPQLCEDGPAIGGL